METEAPLARVLMMQREPPREPSRLIANTGKQTADRVEKDLTVLMSNTVEM